MSKSGTLITIGVLVVLSPFLGIPHSWLSVLLPILGILAVVIGFLIRKEHVSPPQVIESAPPAAPHSYEAPSSIA